MKNSSFIMPIRHGANPYLAETILGSTPPRLAITPLRVTLPKPYFTSHRSTLPSLNKTTPIPHRTITSRNRTSRRTRHVAQLRHHITPRNLTLPSLNGTKHDLANASLYAAPPCSTDTLLYCTSP